MDPIVRRLMKKGSGNSLKESISNAHKMYAIQEADEEEKVEGEDTELVDEPTEDYGDLPPEESETEDTTEETPEDTEEEESVEGEDSEDTTSEEEQRYNVNPLDNPYAVRYTIGDEIVVSYSNGTRTKLGGVVDGYDKEGFYRIRWSNGLTTNGITDLALLDTVKHVEESVCICGSKEFITEDSEIICDKCGRGIRESKSVNESKAYNVRYQYDGDALSDYATNVIIVAESPESALSIAKEKLPDGRHFEIDGEYNSVEEFKSKYPKSNYDIIDESTDTLTLADKSRPKGKRLIRSEAHPISTATASADIVESEGSSKLSIEDSIRKAFSKKKTINESGEYDLEKLRNKLEGEFWTRLPELVEDIEDLGYEVLDSNNEYVIVSWEDDKELQIYIGGTSRTMTLDFDRSRIL